MILWSIKILILSIILIFVSHNLFGFFKDTLTTPKVKDLVNKPQQQYNDIMNTIKKYNNNTKQSLSKSVNNVNNVNTVNNVTQNSKQQTMIDKTQMKDELKHFLNEIKNKPMQSSSNLSSSSNPSSVQSIDSFENSNAFIGNSYQNAYEQR